MARVVPARVEGPLAPYAAGFFEDLLGRGYEVATAERHLFLMGRLSCWLRQRGSGPDALGTAELEGFLQQDHRSFPKSVRGTEPLVGFLRRAGVVPVPPAPELGPNDELLERFCQYLRRERGLTEGTIANYLRAARLFLRSLAGTAGPGLATMSAADVSAFVVAHCPQKSTSAAKNIVVASRSLLRFLYLEGATGTLLSGAVPPASGPSGSGLPRGVDATTVRRLLAACDRRTAKGRRDLAILSMLTRLGLRAGEVVALDLPDFDWERGEVLVRGKACRLERVPVPADVGAALAGYLRRGRPRCAERAVFLTVVAPRHRIGATAVNRLVAAACRRAGLPPIAPHRLRHTVASELVRRGAGLAEIGQLLRHRSAGSTSIYARVDTVALRELARPWPGSAR
jgi:integrase/recombinase XerD